MNNFRGEKIMSHDFERHRNGKAQFRADLPEKTGSNAEPLEQEAVRTTIVGGRPPGSGKPMGNVPRGIEVLLKKAAIDQEFRELLQSDPEAAAKSIALELAPIEQAMLKTMPAEQLEVIINQTEVPQQQRRAFLGTAAAAMLAVLVPTVMTGCPKMGIVPGREHDWVGGAAPDMPENPPHTVSAGIMPDEPQEK